jgi:hypothetical protein
MAPEKRIEEVEPGRIRVSDPGLFASYEVYGNCPVQGLGTVRGREVYFRARHDGWSFDIADRKGDLPSDGRAAPDGFYREGVYPNSGWMPLAEAVRLIDECIREYLRGLDKAG